MESVLQFVRDNAADVWVIVTSIVTIASIIAKITANKLDDNLVGKLVQVLSLNTKAK